MLTTKMLPVLVFYLKKTPTNHMPYPGYVPRVVPFSGVLTDPHFWLTHVELIVMALVEYFISKKLSMGTNWDGSEIYDPSVPASKFLI